jgi:hypothetical protein
VDLGAAAPEQSEQLAVLEVPGAAPCWVGLSPLRLLPGLLLRSLVLTPWVAACLREDSSSFRGAPASNALCPSSHSKRLSIEKRPSDSQRSSDSRRLSIARRL